jgi:hypothetical protein
MITSKSNKSFTDMSTVITTVLIRLATTAALTTGKKLHKELTKLPPFKKAIRSTANDFPQIIVVPSLEKWCESISFRDILESFEDGQRPTVEHDIVTSYIKNGEFYSAANTESDAQKVLASFFAHLEHEIYTSPEGSSALAKRQEVLHEETRDVFREGIAPLEMDMKTLLSRLSEQT